MKSKSSDARVLRGAEASILALLLVAVVVIGVNTYMSRSALESERGAPTVNIPPVDQGEHIVGELEAPVHLIVYTNFDCPFCKDFHERTIPYLQAIFGAEIAIIYRHFPLPRFPNSHLEAAASECVAQLAGEDAFWVFAATLFASHRPEGRDSAELTAIARNMGVPERQFAACLEEGEAYESVAEDRTRALAAGISITPSVVIRKGNTTVLVEGNWYGRMRTAIEQLLQRSP